MSRSLLHIMIEDIAEGNTVNPLNISEIERMQNSYLIYAELVSPGLNTSANNPFRSVHLAEQNSDVMCSSVVLQWDHCEVGLQFIVVHFHGCNAT
jgi:hypothetical protein